MTDAELLELVQEALGDESPADAMTCEEWGERFGLAAAATRRRLKVLIRAGKMEAVRVKRIGELDGVAHWVPAYRLLT